MKVKNSRLETLKMLISSQELSSQDQLLQALAQEGFEITQATLSRDLKLLKVAKAASSSGKYTYVLPNDALYKRVSNHIPISNMAMGTGFLSINFSGNMVVIRTRPGYASSIAYNIDNSDITQILGTIAGDDTIFLVKKKGITEEEIINALSVVIPELSLHD
ncbi:MAG: arginine repressor [Escherichia coli]|jgi:transcriptional regulator of arginine metabolism|uniref:arginine repressor n=1 Tax=Segatella copri TaxID=165179 RepID=UPI001933500A|nr:arginine repressor [Segatella copri]MBD9016565.1 arginine repressor [Prevotella sp.]MBL1008473.1 arginine repressor [Escherichia coli]MBM0130963.1 arginine repressor [Segatella copri]MBM0144136.1 arginine repressor [Segatella copri]MBV3429616.1 arginine repressor [Segatella copri]